MLRRGISIIGGALAMMTVAAGVNAERFYYMAHTGERIGASELPQPTAEQLKNKSVLKSGNITFTAVYLDGAGVGFNDATHGANRKQVVEEVFAYLNTVLSHPGGNCEVRFNASEFDGTGSLASAGTGYFEINGFTNGDAYDHITTGNDPFVGDPDIFCTFDFGYTWNNTMNPPAGGEVDLFSVLLHEITHGLGVASFAESNGTSSASPMNTFTGWDNLLYTDSGTKLWSEPGFAFAGGSLTGGDNTIRFQGTEAQAAFPGGIFPPIYTPNPFETGSSVSHWQLAAPTPANAVMRPSIAAGVSNREFQPFEIGALNDLGYTIASSVGEWMLF